MKKILFMFALSLSFLTLAISAQPRPIDKNLTQDEKEIVSAPVSFEAKYEGGMLGYSRNEKGSLKFDDANERIVFYGKNNKEVFAIAYASMLAISPQSKSVRSTTGKVVGAVPILGAGLLGGLIREKRRYLVIQYADGDADVRGITNFKLDNKDLLDSVIRTLGEKAELTKRGDSYLRSKKISAETTIN